MRSLGRVVYEGMESSKPLKAPFKKWEKAEMLLYRGAVSTIAGPPGCGKTITAINIVNNIGVPTLYFSNDSSRYTMAKRTYSRLSGADARLSAQIVEQRPDIAAPVLAEWGNVRFDFNGSPDLTEMATHGEAFRELYGEYPHLTVLDILMKLDHEGVAEQKYWQAYDALVDLAKEQNTALLVVHHTSEGVKGNPCPPKSSLMGKANQLPELIITQIMKDDQILYSAVKNRNGKDSPEGEKYISLPVDAGRCYIEDEDPGDESEQEQISVLDSMKINTTDWEDM